MTGLDYDNDQIIEIACFITDAELNILDEKGYETVVHQPKEKMDAMDEWCTSHHGSSGLTAKVLESTVTAEQAAEELYTYILKYVDKPRVALFAGNTVHVDREYLRKPPYTKIVEYLHHRIMDVSAIKEAMRRWSHKEVLDNVPKKRGSHTARADILESIEECRYYRDVFFKDARLKREESAPQKEEVVLKKTDPVSKKEDPVPENDEAVQEKV